MTVLKQARQGFIRKISHVFFAGFFVFMAGGIDALTGIEKINESENLQQKTRVVRGTILNNIGNPLIGVSASFNGNSTATMTDVNSKYSIDVSPDLTLKFACIGFKICSTSTNKDIIYVTMEKMPCLWTRLK